VVEIVQGQCRAVVDMELVSAGLRYRRCHMGEKGRAPEERQYTSEELEAESVGLPR
jgi:hypothetical protein